MGLFESDRLIADRTEFAEALQSLRRGHLLLRIGDSASGCVLDGTAVYHSFHTLKAYGLIDKYDNPKGFPGVEYFRISEEGQRFAQRVLDAPDAAAALSQRQLESFHG
jgi:hypothetical protein